MPLIVMSGIPSSGKSTRTKELKEYFIQKNKTVHVVSEIEAIIKAEFNKNEYYMESQKEKHIRGALKSDVLRLLSKDNIIILDGGNYIKGYRYELYCGSKSARTSQCTIYCAVPIEAAWDYNRKRVIDNISIVHNVIDNNQMTRATNDKTIACDISYTREVFDALCLRFEEPNSNNRWDSPLFTVFPGDIFNFEDIFSCLFEKKPPPPNMSTQNPPLSATNYLYEMDQITQNITSAILTAQKMGQEGSITVPGKTKLIVECPQVLTASQLTRLRRQFLTYSKMHSTSSNIEQVPQLFVQFLNTNLN